MNECERDPCPVGSRCVNTRGSFSCECPLGFDLEDGRTCTRGKTSLIHKAIIQSQMIESYKHKVSNLSLVNVVFQRPLMIHWQYFVPLHSKDISGNIQCEQTATWPCYLQEPHHAWDPERDHSAGERQSTSLYPLISENISIRLMCI